VSEIQLQVTITAEAEVTKAADLRAWRITGVFDDDEATVEAGRGSVYLRTGSRQAGLVAMLRPDDARELARALNAAADKSTPTEQEHP
jgi:hypothetical protein